MTKLYRNLKDRANFALIMVEDMHISNENTVGIFYPYSI